MFVYAFLLFLAVMFSFVNISQVISWESWVFCTSQAGCYTISNSTHAVVLLIS